MKKSFCLGLLSFALLNAEDIQDALKQTEIEGYTYGQVTSMFGSDASGSAFSMRVWLDLQTGAINGFSLGSRIFADLGTGGPDGGSFLDNSGKPNESLNLSLMSLYGQQTFQEAKTTLDFGKINIVTPFTDSQWDFGYGLSIANHSLQHFSFHLQGYGAFGLDNWNDIHQSPYAQEGESMNSSRPLFIGGIHAEELNGFGFDLWIAHAIKTIDFLTFADLNYTISNFTLQTQIATTQVDTQNPYFNQGILSAKLRGLYNVQASYDNGDFGILAGYTGSFGDGYGALLNYCASFNMGGNLWWDIGGGNGYALNGVGGFKQNNKKTDISVFYAQTHLSKIEKLFLALSYAYVWGNNQYRLTQKGFDRHTTSLLGGSINAKLHEVSLMLNYDITEKLSLFALVGSTFGDLQIGKAQAKISYSF